MTYLTEKRLVCLASEGQVPLPLRTLWEERNGKDPLFIAGEVVRHNRIHAWLTFGPLALAPLLMFLGLALLFVFPMEKESVEKAQSFGMIALLCIMGLSWLLPKFYKDGSDRFSWDERSFVGTFSTFIDVSGKTPAELANMKQDELQALARRLLVDRALAVVRFEKKYEGDIVPVGHRRSEKEELMRSFEQAHACLSRLSLVGKDYGPYYREAAKEQAA